jgi:hypothetical protein
MQADQILLRRHLGTCRSDERGQQEPLEQLPRIDRLRPPNLASGGVLLQRSEAESAGGVSWVGTRMIELQLGSFDTGALAECARIPTI